MRRLATIFVLGVVAAIPLVASGSAAAATCPGQSTYLPNQASDTVAAAITAAVSANGLGSIAADGTVKVSFNSSVCGGFRLVLRGKEIRPGKAGLGFPKHDGFTTLANVLVIIPAGPVTVNFTLTGRGLALLKYARSHGQSLTVFVIAHIRPRDVSSEAIQITSVG